MKEKFKKWLLLNPKGQKFNLWYVKNKRKILGVGLGTILFALVGGVFIIIGFYLAGWNVFAWFGSSQAFAFYGIAIVLIPIIIWLCWALKHKE